MTAAPARHRLVSSDPRDLADRLGEALQVYVAAMGYPPSTARQRRALWLDHVRRPGWRAVGWLDAGGRAARHRLRLHRRSRASGGTRRSGAACAAPRPRRATGCTTTSSSPSCTSAPTPRASGSARACCGRCSPGTDRRRRAAVDARVRPPAAGPRVAALPAHGLRGRAARPPLHRRLPPVRRAGRDAAARPPAPRPRTPTASTSACA